MPRTLSANNQTEVVKTVTRPVYLVEFGFATPLRLSSRGDITYDGDLYESATLQVSLTPPNPSIRLFNDQLAFGTTFIAEGTQGISVTVLVLYGDAPFSAGDADVYHDGELGAATIADWIEAQLLPHRPQFSPKIMATEDLFSYLPPEGTEFETLAGTIYLARRQD